MVDWLESSDTPTPRVLVIYGPSGVGKTWCAATISKQWPDSLPAKTPAKLTDVLTIGFDENPFVGFHEAGIEIPHTIDYWKLVRAGKVKNISEFVSMLPGIVKKAIEDNPEITAITLDSVSQMLFELKNFHQNETDFGANGWKVYDILANKSQKLIGDLRKLPVHKVLLFHSKAMVNAAAITVASKGDRAKDVDKMQSEAFKAKLEVMGIDAAGENNVALDISAESIALLNYFTYNADVKGKLVKKTKTLPGKTEVTRVLELDSLEDSTKSRHQFALGKTEDANLRKILTKLGVEK